MFLSITSYIILIGVFVYLLFANKKNSHKDYISYTSLALMLQGAIIALLSSTLFTEIVMVTISLGWLYSFYYFYNIEDDEENILQKNINFIKDEFDIMEYYEKFLIWLMNITKKIKSIFVSVTKKIPLINWKKEKYNHLREKPVNIDDDFWSRGYDRFSDEYDSIDDYYSTSNRPINETKITPDDKDVVDPEKFFNQSWLNSKPKTNEESGMTPEEIRIKRIQDLFK